MEIITTTPDALQSLVTNAVRDVLAKAQPAPHEYLTIAEAAEYIRMSPAGMRKWVDAGELPRFTFGRVTRIRRADIDALLATSKSVKR